MAAQSSSKRPLGDRGDSPRVAIPRMKKPAHGRDSGSSDKSRVPVACTNCRLRKVKCTGEMPRCTQCINQNVECEYKTPRKDRLKIATEHNLEFIRLLEDLSLRVGGADEKRINDLVMQVRADINTTASLFGVVSPTGHQGEGSVGSNEDIEFFDDTIGQRRNPSDVGFLGGTSAIQWLKTLRDDLGKLAAEPSSIGYRPPAASHDPIAPPIDPELPKNMFSGVEQAEVTHDSTFYLDDELLEVDSSVEATGLPTYDDAQVLIASYMRMAQGSFPILPQKRFEAEVDRCFSNLQESSSSTTNCSPPWLAMLNLVFAVGARYAHLTGDARVNEHDHAIYFSRAHVLHLHVAAECRQVDIFTVRNTAILAIYFLCAGHINRAWIAIGVSVRCAQSLGLNVRGESGDGSAIEEEILARTWWAIYCLERILSIHTGRPSMITGGSCSVTPPLPVSEDDLAEDASEERIREHRLHHSLAATSLVLASSTEGTNDQNPRIFQSYLEAAVKLSAITQSVLRELYSIDPTVSSWKDSRRTISSLVEQLNEWVNSLPPKLGFHGQGLDPDGVLERTILGFQYYSAKMSITVPCLRRINQRLEHQTSASNAFDIRTAQMCVHAAKSITNLLPDEPAPKYMYWSGPAWSVVHYMMEALAVFLSEITYDYTRVVSNQEDLGLYIKKLMYWLHEMGSSNRVAEKSYRVAWDHINAIVASGKAQLSDLVHEEHSALSSQAPPLLDPLVFGHQHSEIGLAHQGIAHTGQQVPVPPGPHLQEGHLQYVAYPGAADPSSIASAYQFPDLLQEMHPVYDAHFITPYGEDAMLPPIPLPASPSALPAEHYNDFNM